MRLESLLWTALAMFLMGGAAWNTDSLVGAGSGSRDYQSADGASSIPPPLMDPGTQTPASLKSK